MKKIFPAIALVAIVFAVYAPALRNDFVWDDTALVLRDPLIRSWRLIPEGFRHFLFTDATASDFYRPIQRLTYTFDYALFVFRPAGYHLSNIVFHALTALALLLLGRELLSLFGVEESKRNRIAFLAALAWAIHPLHSSAVVYVAGRADPLAAFFGFFGLYLGIRSFDASSRRRWFLLGIAGSCLLLSALSKETGIVFLLLWFALLLLKRKWKEFVPVTVTAVLVISIYLSLRLSAEHIPAPRFREPTPVLVRPIVAARAVTEYAGLILWPTNLHMDRDVEKRPETGPQINKTYGFQLQTILGILLIGGFVYWLIRSRKQNGAVFCCLIFAILTYLPVSALFSLNANIAEHWLYLPTAFLFLAIGLAISSLHIPTLLIGSALAAWLLFLGARTWIRTFDWKNQRTFLESTLATGGDSARMLINLAGLELREGKLDSAKDHLHLALKKEPDQPLAILNLATVAVRQDDFAAAHELLTRAMKVPFTKAKADELMAVLDLRQSGLINLPRFQLAARTSAGDWSIERRYIQALDESGATSEAIAELNSCLSTQWYRAESWQYLSELLTKAGRTAEATQAQLFAKKYDVHLGEH